jgi:uncharacterized protein YbjT (DUF2867 family)
LAENGYTYGMNPEPSLLVTGASGLVGRSVLRALRECGIPAAAAVRDLKRAPAEAAKAVDFDFARPETFAPALAGRDQIFLVGPPMMSDMDELLRPFIEHIKTSTTREVVYLSAYGMDCLPELPFHAVNEQRLRAASNLKVTILRSGFFAQNFATYSRQDIEERGVLFLPTGQGKTPFVDVADVGRCAAAVFSKPELAGQTYTLTGPEAWSMDEVASCLTRLLGRSIANAAPDPELFRATLLQAGVPAHIISYLTPIYSLILRGVVETVSHDVQRLTGRPPRATAAVLTEQFGGTPKTSPA